MREINTSRFGSSVSFKGGFLLDEDMIIKGAITGFITSKKDLIIDESAILRANLKAKNVVVKGKIEGNVEADDKLEITATGQIIGDIKAKIVSILPGGHLIGQCYSDLVNYQDSSDDNSQEIKTVERTKKGDNQAFGKEKLRSMADKILSMFM